MLKILAELGFKNPFFGLIQEMLPKNIPLIEITNPKSADAYFFLYRIQPLLYRHQIMSKKAESLHSGSWFQLKKWLLLKNCKLVIYLSSYLHVPTFLSPTLLLKCKNIRRIVMKRTEFLHYLLVVRVIYIMIGYGTG